MDESAGVAHSPVQHGPDQHSLEQPGPMPEWARLLHEDLTELVRRSDGHWELAVACGEVRLAIGAGRTVSAASTIKVPLVIAALARVEAGHADLTEVLAVPNERVGGTGVLGSLPSCLSLTLAEVLELCIIVSDNTATNMLIERFGLDTVGASMRGLGLHETVLRRRMLDLQAMQEGRDNLAQAQELAELLARLGEGRLLSPALTEFAVSMLQGQRIRDRIPSRLPADVAVGNKTGELVGICHDVGLLQFDGHQVGFAALGSDLSGATFAGGSGEAALVIATAARSVLDRIRGGGAAAGAP